jgi:hypothetical protein
LPSRGSCRREGLAVDTIREGLAVERVSLRESQAKAFPLKSKRMTNLQRKAEHHKERGPVKTKSKKKPKKK